VIHLRIPAASGRIKGLIRRRDPKPLSQPGLSESSRDSGRAVLYGARSRHAAEKSGRRVAPIEGIYSGGGTGIKKEANTNEAKRMARRI